MTNAGHTPRTDTPLPLTDLSMPDPGCETVSEEMIRTLVDSFYDEVRRDVVLGPIFEEHVADWSAHLPKMYNFWSTVVLRTGRYSGRPLEAHEKLPALTRSHFDRWLGVWTGVVTRTLPEAARPLFIEPAQRMAITMATRLAVTP